MSTNLPDRRRLITALVTGVVLVALTALNLNAKLTLRPLPTIDGYYRFLGLEERAEVIRDGFGVPRIYANNEHDLFFLQGYVTAQDRFAQMDELRDRVLVAWDSDRPPEIPPALDAYAAGVNKWIEQHAEAGALPAEIALSGTRPEAWTSLDSLGIVYSLVNSSGGSGCAVVAGADTVRGRPILTADLRADGPEPGWYELGLEAGSMRALGLTMPGIPGIIAGHNGFVAWSTAGVSVTDPIELISALIELLTASSASEVGPKANCAADASGAMKGAGPMSAGLAKMDAELARDTFDPTAPDVPGARMVIDLGDLDASKAAISTGQSAHSASRHHMDQRQLWEAGQLHRLVWTREKIARIKGQLVLRPR